MKMTEMRLRVMVREEFLRTAEDEGRSPTLTEGIRWHLEEGVPFDSPVYRVGTQKYFSLIREAKKL
jgi:hypothetical protein